MKEFETPTLRYVAFAAKDILTASAQEPTEPRKPRPSDFITPEDDFDDEPTGQ